MPGIAGLRILLMQSQSLIVRLKQALTSLQVARSFRGQRRPVWSNLANDVAVVTHECLRDLEHGLTLEEPAGSLFLVGKGAEAGEEFHHFWFGEKILLELGSDLGCCIKQCLGHAADFIFDTFWERQPPRSQDARKTANSNLGSHCFRNFCKHSPSGWLGREVSAAKASLST